MEARLFYKAVLDLMPAAMFETDHEGQLVIYTGMQEVDRDQQGYPQRIVLLPDLPEER